MFALLALLCFVVALFIDHLGPLSLVTLGLAFIALHLLWAIALPFGTRRANTVA